MIEFFVEAKRRLAWHGRLDRSILRLEADAGGRSALWVFDTVRGPDGYALQNRMVALARREGLKLFSFGPADERPASARAVVSALRSDPERGFAVQAAERIAQAAGECDTSLFVVGSSRGTFARALAPSAEIWEVQHGLLDSSYFPVRADRFFARSQTSFALLARSISVDRLAMLSDDLVPPSTKPSDLAGATSLVCYSKNPGGGCSAQELVQLERAAVSLAHRLGLPFQLMLHPRDTRMKLLARHRRLSILRHLRPLTGLPAGPRVVLSSFSTALTAESRPGDRLLNVALSPIDPVAAAEYGWLPNITLSQLEEARASDLTVLECL